MVLTDEKIANPRLAVMGQLARGMADELRHPLGTIRNAASKLGGREVAERLQQTRPGICVVYMSGFADDTIVQHDAMHQVVALWRSRSARRV